LSSGRNGRFEVRVVCHSSGGSLAVCSGRQNIETFHDRRDLGDVIHL